MRALADTHVFLWVTSDMPRVSPRAREFLEDGTNEVLLSVASVWEIAIKFAKGQLRLPEPPGSYVPSRMAKHSFEALPILRGHALQVADLPPHHRDPFDRLLIAQAQIEEVPLLTSDPNISRYEVEVIW